MRRLTLCADDFALSTRISETIVELASLNKINATSCMAVCKSWRSDSRLLAQLPNAVQVGLHLTLTDEVPLTPMRTYARDGVMPAIDALARRCILGSIPLNEIAAEISAQFEEFEAATGWAPDFVDGHQHVHSLPGIRQLVLQATRRYAPAAWLRDCTDGIHAINARPWRLKAFASAAQSIGLASAARANGLATNRGFAGHYDFASDYVPLFPTFLRRSGSDHLIMCHPGAGAAPGDSIAAARVREAHALRHFPIHTMAEDHGLEFAIS